MVRASVRATTKASALVLLVLGVTACGDLKPAGPSGAAVDSGTVVDSGVDSGVAVDPGRTGPGAHGSLPSGYCCTADTECRYRHCVDVGSGNKMCLDECKNPEFCTRPGFTFTCPSN